MNRDQEGNGKWSPISKAVFIGFALIAGYFLILEHRAHVVQFLPVLLVLACPLMHLFHRHGGHGGGRDRDKGPSREKSRGGKEHHHH